MNVQMKILDEKVRDIPKYGTTGSAAVDLNACIDDNIVLKPGECKLIGTGIAIHVADPGYAALILPRSGLGHKKGLVLGNGTGLIDSDYQGELKVSCFNRSLEDINIEPLMRFAQLVIVPVVQANFEVVKDFTSASGRGVGGFGHTGA